MLTHSSRVTETVGLTGFMMGGQEAARLMGNVVLMWREEPWFTVTEVGIII